MCARAGWWERGLDVQAPDEPGEDEVAWFDEGGGDEGEGGAG